MWYGKVSSLFITFITFFTIDEKMNKSRNSLTLFNKNIPIRLTYSGTGKGKTFINMKF